MRHRTFLLLNIIYRQSSSQTQFPSPQKALTAYFLREAHAIYKISPSKSLSPSYADAERWPKRRRGERKQEGKVPGEGKGDNKETPPEEEKDAPFPVVLTNIEHSLGRWVCLSVVGLLLIIMIVSFFAIHGDSAMDVLGYREDPV
jgi:hypothetical protein